MKKNYFSENFFFRFSEKKIFFLKLASFWHFAKFSLIKHPKTDKLPNNFPNLTPGRDELRNPSKPMLIAVRMMIDLCLMRFSFCSFPFSIQDTSENNKNLENFFFFEKFPNPTPHSCYQPLCKLHTP